MHQIRSAQPGKYDCRASESHAKSAGQASWSLHTMKRMDWMSMQHMKTIEWSLHDEVECHPGHLRKQVSFDTCHVALHRYLPGGGGYEVHEHPELQAGIILYGEMAMEFPDGPRLLGPGDLYIIPGGIPHGGKAGGQAEALVLNLYLRPHLMVAEDAGIAVSNLEALRRGTLNGINASIRRIDLAPGERLLADQVGTVDEFDILLSGTASVDAMQAAKTLSRFDVVPWSETKGGMITAGGPEGAILARIAIPEHRG